MFLLEHAVSATTDADADLGGCVVEFGGLKLTNDRGSCDSRCSTRVGCLRAGGEMGLGGESFILIENRAAASEPEGRIACERRLSPILAGISGWIKFA